MSLWKSKGVMMETKIDNAEIVTTKRVNKHGTITGFKKFRGRIVIVAVLSQAPIECPEIDATATPT